MSEEVIDDAAYDWALLRAKDERDAARLAAAYAAGVAAEREACEKAAAAVLADMLRDANGKVIWKLVEERIAQFTAIRARGQAPAAGDGETR